MKPSSIGLLATFLQPYVAYGRKVDLSAAGDDGLEPYIRGDTVQRGSGRYREVFSCDEGDTPFLTSNKQFAACCRDGERLRESEDSEWHCCAAGHDLAGSGGVGYQCCLEGYIFDGTECKK